MPERSVICDTAGTVCRRMFVKGTAKICLSVFLLSAKRLRHLQVKNQQGQWIKADPIPGTFVCNIGDMLKVCAKLAVMEQSAVEHVTSCVLNFNRCCTWHSL